MGETRTSTIIDEAIASGDTVTKTITAREREVVVVFWSMSNATNKNDLGDLEVRAIDPDGNVLHDVLTDEVVSANSLNGVIATCAKRYNAQGLNELQITVTNTAAASRDTKVFVNHYWS